MLNMLAMAGLAEAVEEEGLIIGGLLLFICTAANIVAAVVPHGWRVMLRCIACCIMLLFSMLFQPWSLFAVRSNDPDPDVVYWHQQFFALAVAWIVLIVFNAAFWAISDWRRPYLEDARARRSKGDPTGSHA